MFSFIILHNSKAFLYSSRITTRLTAGCSVYLNQKNALSAFKQFQINAEKMQIILTAIYYDIADKGYLVHDDTRITSHFMLSQS